eukprot:656729-Hanusia_phi.AAC.1
MTGAFCWWRRSLYHTHNKRAVAPELTEEIGNCEYVTTACEAEVNSQSELVDILQLPGGAAGGAAGGAHHLVLFLLLTCRGKRTGGVSALLWKREAHMQSLC